jgi:Ubiquitin carboxyl-terminal hydrolase
MELLTKYDGETWTETTSGGNLIRRRYRIKYLPNYLLLPMSRFTKNNFFAEKNRTIITFPVKNLELKHLMKLPSDSTMNDIIKTINELSNGSYKIDGSEDRLTLLSIANEMLSGLPSKYDLIASVCHDSGSSSGADVTTAAVADEK